MKIAFTKNNGDMTVSVAGRLDTVTAPELETLLGEQYEGSTSITFDCQDLSYVSSAGLRVLLTAHKRMKGRMKLTGVGELVMEVFEMTGFADVWEIV